MTGGPRSEWNPVFDKYPNRFRILGGPFSSSTLKSLTEHLTLGNPGLTLISQLVLGSSGHLVCRRLGPGSSSVDTDVFQSPRGFPSKLDSPSFLVRFHLGFSNNTHLLWFKINFYDYLDSLVP